MWWDLWIGGAGSLPFNPLSLWFADAISATNPRVIDDSRARKLSNDLKRCTYYETCATYGLNVERVFQDGNCSHVRVSGQDGAAVRSHGGVCAALGPGPQAPTRVRCRCFAHTDLARGAGGV